MSSVPRTPPLAGDKPQPYIFLAGSGTPGYENWVHWLMGESGVVCATHPAPGGGQAPALHFSIDAGGRRQAREPLQPIPDRSPGHAFIAIAHAGFRRHTDV